MWRYMYHMYQLDAFTQSCPADQDIINHYKLQQVKLIDIRFNSSNNNKYPAFNEFSVVCSNWIQNWPLTKKNKWIPFDWFGFFCSLFDVIRSFRPFTSKQSPKSIDLNIFEYWSVQRWSQGIYIECSMLRFIQQNFVCR